MTQIFLFFLGISASVSLIILASISLAPFLNKRYAAKWKRLIWIFLAVRLLVPFGGVVLCQDLVQVKMRNFSLF